MSSKPTADFRELTNLAARRLGAGAVAANDEFFAEKENLLNPGRAAFSAHTFGHKGQIYDGWETRRRRDAGHDWVIVRLGAAGIVRGVVIDTGNFTGNYPEEASIEATSIDGHPGVSDLANAEWVYLVSRSALKGDQENLFAINSEKRWTHIRLSIFPDGGVARLRVHGIVVPDPRWILSVGTIDLASLENGGDLIGCSDDFYSSARNTLQPGPAQSQGDGWENRRRRHGGNDWFAVSLAAPAIVRAIEVDTTHFKGNAPGWISVSGGNSSEVINGIGPTSLVERIPTQPDTPHRYVLSNTAEVSAVRLDVYPDGGVGRFRVWGEPTTEGLKQLTTNWWNSLPDSQRESLAIPYDLEPPR
jgi:allantoicase